MSVGSAQLPAVKANRGAEAIGRISTHRVYQEDFVEVSAQLPAERTCRKAQAPMPSSFKETAATPVGVATEFAEQTRGVR